MTQNQIATAPKFKSQGLLRRTGAALHEDMPQRPPRSGRGSPQVNFFEVHFLEKIHKNK
jgi:hypothetical protein